MRRLSWGFRTRLTALFVAIFGLTLVAFSAILYNVFVHGDQAQLDVALYNHAVDVAGSIQFDLFGDFSVSPDVLSGGGKIFPFSIGKTYLQILDRNGTVIARSAALGRRTIPVFKSDWEAAFREGAAFRTIHLREIDPEAPGGHINHRLLTYIAHRGMGPAFAIQMSVPMTFLEQSTQGLLTLFIVGVPLTLLIAALGGLYLSRRALAPVSDIIAKAQRLNPERLSERIPVPQVDDEFRSLSLTLNELLERLEQAFRSQERFIADASHELKTPLAILRGELDVLKSRPRSAEEVTQFLESSSEELSQLSRTVEDLLLLARVDAGASTLHTQNLQFDDLSLEVVGRLEKLGRNRGVRVRVDLSEGDFQAQGDADLLRIAVKNLVENAIKFSPPDEVVDVRIFTAAAPDFLELQVRDRGPGIPPEMRERIFDRFFRIKSHSGAGGSGLGLAIAKRIVELHAGSVGVTEPLDGGPGSLFFLRIKRF